MHNTKWRTGRRDKMLKKIGEGETRGGWEKLEAEGQERWKENYF